MSGLHWYGWLMLAACIGMGTWDAVAIVLNACRGTSHPQPFAWFAVWTTLAIALVVAA